jgi:[acyl-carrier-protein] S-malonyltransferase
MGKIAFLFAGQGAQSPGMGRELYENSPAARQVFDRLEALRPGTIKQCFDGSPEELAQTINTQPCLFAVDLAAAYAAQEKGLRPELCAGFSLGETAAAAFTGMLPLEKAFTFVMRRAEWMQECADEKPGFMAAVLRLERDQVISLCKESLNIYPVNFNAPGQVAVAGEVSQKEAFLQAVAQRGGRALPLKVSGGFHSPLMAKAATKLAGWLQGEQLAAPSLPLYANRTGKPYDNGRAALLSQQVDHPVLWEDTIRNMAADGADLFVELGPGTVLSGLVSKILPGAAVCHIEDAKSLTEAATLTQGR